MTSVMAVAQDWVLPFALWIIMFGIGLSLRPNDFRRITTHRKSFVLGAASMIFVVPAIGIALAVTVSPSPPLLMGLILLATTPGGILSNVLTDIAGGDLALSVSLSIFVSVVYIVTLPFIVQVALSAVFGHGAAVAIPFSSSFFHILMVTLFPIATGMIVRPILPSLSKRIAPSLKQAATTTLVIIFVVIIIQQFDTLRHAVGRLMLVVVAMNVVNVAWAAAMCRGARLGRAEAIAVVNEHLIRQEGTAIYVAVSLLKRNDMSLPMIVNSFVGILIGTLFVVLARRLAPAAGSGRHAAAERAVSPWTPEARRAAADEG